MPQFSVIIPCFNAETYLGDAIESCLNQTAGDLEIIIVDDGSTDRSSEIALEYAGTDARVRVIRHDNRGVGAARNTGLADSTGEFVSFLDADDLIEPDKLMVQGLVLQQNPSIGVVLCDGTVIDHRGDTIWEHLVDKRRLLGHPPLFDVCFRGGPFPPLVPLVRRTLANAVGGFDPDPDAAGWADIGFWMRIALTGTDYHLVPQQLVRYRRTTTSMSADREAMDRAAVSIYAKVMSEKPQESARALISAQGRLRDAEVAADQLRAAMVELASESDERDHLVADNTRLKHTCDSLWQTLFEFLRRESLRKDGRPILIWGAGSAGQRLLPRLSRAGIQVHAFIDSDGAKTGTRVAGLPICAPEVLFFRDPPRPIVLVASIHAEAIGTQLQACGWCRGSDYIIANMDLLPQPQPHHTTLLEVSA